MGHSCIPNATHDPADELHVAVIGDSLSTGFHLASPFSMILGARGCHHGNWALDDSGRINSVFERIGRTRPVILHHLATVSAHVKAAFEHTPLEHILGTKHVSQQVDQIIRLEKLPNIVLTWIGHNNLDWIRNGNALSREQSLQAIADRTVQDFGLHLGRLIKAAVTRQERIYICVFGLVDFARFFQARTEAELLQKSNKTLYPMFEKGYSIFESMRMPHRAGMVECALKINSGFARLVQELRSQRQPFIDIEFSDALHRADISKAESLTHVDAWHPSATGHSILASSVWPQVEQILRTF